MRIPASFARHLLSLAVAVVALGTASLAQAGAVEVKYIDAERFTDAGRGRALEEVEATLTRHLQQLGAKVLPAGQSLTIEITDVDLAGELRPWHRIWPDTRIMRGRVDWPRISLRYTLREGDRVIRSGTEQVADMSYLDSSRWHGIDERDELAYERRMLSAWFNERFAAAP